MRIIIEVEDQTGVTRQTDSDFDSEGAQNAGTPSEGLPELQADSDEDVGAMDAGSPPEWLREAVEASASTETEFTETTASDAGVAPEE